MYLASVGSDVLGPDAEGAVGLSEETTCYVTMDYFDEDDRFADYVVHEVAHIFHNCKRETIGLPHTRRREWLLDIEFRPAGDVRVCVRGQLPLGGARSQARRATRTAERAARTPRPIGRTDRSGSVRRGISRSGAREKRLEADPVRLRTAARPRASIFR
jgi:hypothetical protein